MRKSLLTLSLLVACSALHATPSSVSGEPAWTPPTDVAVLALAELPAGKVAAPLLRWNPIDPVEVEALRKSNAAEGTKRLRIGIERDSRERDAKEVGWAWSTLADGTQVARLRVQSPDAEALRVALDLRGLPDGAELRFAADGERESVIEPVGAAAIAVQRSLQPLYWGPVTDGDTQLVELRLPAGASRDFLRLDVAAVSHLLVSPNAAWDGAKIGESGACNVDVRCETSPSQAFLNAKNATAKMVYQEGRSSYLCTGTLLNDTDNSTQVPYFYTAAHCFTSQTVANTLTTFWFYESTACRSNTLDSGSRQLGGGAEILHANEGSDVLLLRLRNAPPAGSYFLGWDSNQVSANTDALFIHHPSGDVKKRSLGRITGIGTSPLASGSFIQAGYTSGTTEGGSSGCGLLTLSGGEYRLRGGLLGGSASCSNSGTIGRSGNQDVYSRLDLAFPNLRQYLSPSNTPTPNPPVSTDFTGAWSNPNQNGWGVVVIRAASGNYGMYVYHYDQDSSPAWYLSAGALSGSTFNADLFAFTGPWFGTSPFNPGRVTSRGAGNLRMNFTSASTADVSFTIDGRTVLTTLSKLSF